MANINKEKLKKLVTYNPKTGIFTRNKNNKLAGYKRSDGYVCLTVTKTKYLAHRLAWLFMTGEWPKNEIDHDNKKRNDNRWKNLREATSLQQMGNTKLWKSNTSGYRGVSFHKHTKKWRATIKTKQIGLFNSKEEAKKAYDLVAKEYFGEFYKK